MTKRKKISIGFLMLIPIIVIIVNLVFDVNTAMRFDEIHFYMLLLLILLPSIFSKYDTFKELLLNNFMYSTVFAIVSIIAYNLHDFNDKYFSVEMSSYSWDIESVIIYTLTFQVLGAVAWWLKKKIIQQMISRNLD